MITTKVIRIPPGEIVTGTGEDGVEKKSDFKRFLILALNSYAPSGKGVAQIRQACKIEDLIREANGTIVLEKNDYDVVRAAVEAGSWVPEPSRRFARAGFFDAVLEAMDPRDSDAAGKK